MRRSLVLVTTLLAVAALAQPALAAGTVHPGPVKAPATVIATELSLTHSGYGTLVFQPQIDVGADATSFSAHADRSPATNGLGHWVVPATTVDTARPASGMTNCRFCQKSKVIDRTLTKCGWLQ